MPRITGIYETVLYDPDLGRSQRFYTRLLGRDPVHMDHDRGLAFRISAHDILLVFNPGRTVEHSDLVPSHGCTGEGHAAFSIEASEISAWRKRLAELGIGVEREVAWPTGAFSLYFRDPAGNSLELVAGQIWAGGDDPGRV